MVFMLKKFWQNEFSMQYLQCNEQIDKKYSVVVAFKLYRGVVMSLLCLISI